MSAKRLAVKTSIFLLIFSLVSITNAQKKKSDRRIIPRFVIGENPAETGRIKDFAFLVEIAKDSAVSVRIQKTENNQSLTDSASNKNLIDFFKAFSDLQNAKILSNKKLDPIIVTKADKLLEFGKIEKVIQSLQVSSKQKIKLQIAENLYVAIPHLPDSENNTIPKPNPLFLLVEFQNDGKIILNNELQGAFENLNPLKQRLKEVFQSRGANGGFRVGSNEIEKTVFVKMADSIKFADAIKLIEAINEAGSNPIGLQIGKQSLPDVPASLR